MMIAFAFVAVLLASPVETTNNNNNSKKNLTNTSWVYDTAERWILDPNDPSCLANNDNNNDNNEYYYCPATDYSSYFDNTDQCATAACSVGSFCGRDGHCHVYSCQNWYQYAHPFYTKYQAGSSPPLECLFSSDDGMMMMDRSFRYQSVECGDGYYPYAVAYIPPPNNNNNNNNNSSHSSEYGFSCHSPKVLGIRMNKKCTAVPQVNFSFVCYELDDDSPASLFDNYLAEVASWTNNHNHHNNNQTDNSTTTTAAAIMGTHVLNVVATSLNTGLHSALPANFSVDMAQRTMIAQLNSEPRHHVDKMFPISCPDGCTHLKFCGKDGHCHPYNCKEIYRFAPVMYTGNPTETLDGLNCTTQPAEENLACAADKVVESGARTPWPIAAHFHVDTTGFYTYFSGSFFCDDQDDGFTDTFITFNRQCHTPEFECYDFDPNIDLTSVVDNYLNKSAADYNDAVAQIQGPAGNNSTFLYPNHIYAASLSMPTFKYSAHGSYFGPSHASLDTERLVALVQSRTTFVAPPPTSDMPTSSDASRSLTTTLFAAVGMMMMLPLFLLY